MSQYNDIKITPNIGVSSDPKIEFIGAGNSTVTLKVLDTVDGGILFEGQKAELLSLIDADVSVGSSIPSFGVNDYYGLPQIQAYNDGRVIIAPYGAQFIGVGTTQASSKLTIQAAEGSQALDIGTDLAISDSGVFNPKVTIGSSVGAASTEKMEISAVSRENGLLEIANYGGNQLFSVSNDQSETAFSIYRYANYEDLSITSFENRKLFNVSSLGIVTTYGALRVGTSNTIADSSVYNELYGRLNVKAPFSTATEYVSIVPKFSDKGALSFEAPVGTAQTDRGTQIFSISNNLDSSIFRVNDLNRNPIFEASASGNAGIGTTNPQVGLDVATEAQFRNRVGFSQTAIPDDLDTIDIEPVTPGISTYAVNSAIVVTSNRYNRGSGTGQAYNVENNEGTVFRVNVVGYGITTLPNPKQVYQALDVSPNGDVKIFDTNHQRQIIGFSSLTPRPGDGDMFRVDAFSSTFIGSFPTVSKALRVDKFGLIEVNRDINQISGIATVGLGSTSSPSLNSTMSFELTNNTTLTVRVKGTDGVVRTGIITLS
jgi:hypothetical protein